MNIYYESKRSGCQKFDNTPIQTTIGSVKKSVPMLQLSEADFIGTIQQRIPATPANYLSIVEKNITGDLSDINPIDLEAGGKQVRSLLKLKINQWIY